MPIKPYDHLYFKIILFYQRRKSVQILHQTYQIQDTLYDSYYNVSLIIGQDGRIPTYQGGMPLAHLAGLIASDPLS